MRSTDDDYNNYGPYDLFPLRNYEENVARSGQTRRRAWEVKFTSTTALRVEGIEFEPAKGS